MKIACKVCLSRFEIDEDHIGKKVECPFCKSIFKFSKDRIILFFVKNFLQQPRLKTIIHFF